VRAYQRLGGRPLQERLRLGVHRRTEEVARGRIPDLEADRGIEDDELDEIRRAKPCRLARRYRRRGGRDQLGNRPHRLDAEHLRRGRGALAAAAGGRQHDREYSDPAPSAEQRCGHDKPPSPGE